MQMALTCASINSLFISSPQSESFLLARAPPYAVPLVGPKREIEAFWLDRAPGANLLGLCYLLRGSSGRRDGKEQVRITGPAGGSEPPMPSRSQHAFLLSAFSLALHESHGRCAPARWHRQRGRFQLAPAFARSRLRTCSRYDDVRPGHDGDPGPTRDRIGVGSDHVPASASISAIAGNGSPRGADRSGSEGAGELRLRPGSPGAEAAGICPGTSRCRTGARVPRRLPAAVARRS